MYGNLNIGAGDSLEWLVAALVELDGARNTDRSHHRISIAGTADRILRVHERKLQVCPSTYVVENRD